MIDYDEALRRLLAGVDPLPAEQVSAHDAVGRVLAADVASGESLPPFDNSAMDGFALAAGVDALAPGAEIDVVGERAAGDGYARLEAGAIEIMTGAPMPAGADAIVPVEQVEVLARDAVGRPARIRLAAAVRPGQHLRRAGEDVRAGEVLLAQGRLLREAEATLLMATGIAHVAVRRRPRVALVTTGRELVDDPSARLAPGHIRNSNAPFLAARLAAAGADVVLRETVADDAAAFRAALARARAAQADLVLTTGAVSMGRYDFIPAVLEAEAATLLFHKVRIRPGKPILAARLAEGTRLVGLPGNPASTAVGLRFFVEPMLRAMLGLPRERLPKLPLARAYAKRVPLRMHLKARVALDAEGGLRVHVLGGQESFRIRPLVDANAWVVVPADVEALDAGALVEVAGRGHLEPVPLEA
ncbi:MAG: gephyrin-like molybdotransferase Glp [Pseudomonadota bacterium]